MPDYQKGKIYKIIDNTNDNVYYGSTCEPTVARRLAKHVGNFKCFLKGKSSYVTSYDIITNEDYGIFLVEKYPCTTKDELTSRERYYIENNDCINKIVPGRTKKEWRVVNREALSINKKEYYEKNKEAISIKQKEYREDNKESIKEYNKKYREDNKESIKEYYEKNKESIKEYYEKNKEAINIKRREKYQEKKQNQLI